VGDGCGGRGLPPLLAEAVGLARAQIESVADLGISRRQS
jgi:hypothetical protein